MCTHPTTTHPSMVEWKQTLSPEHLRHRLLTDSRQKRYYAGIPMWDKVSNKRKKMWLPFLLPFVLFASMVSENPDMWSAAMVDCEMLPPQYFKHPVRKAWGNLACPVSLYSDGVPHTKEDSVVAFYWTNLLKPTRHLICLIRKSDMCRCACKGQCTMDAVLRVITWSFNVLASSLWPTERHDGKPANWHPKVGKHGPENSGWGIGSLVPDGSMAGARGALCEYRCDMLEMIVAFGFKMWTHISKPCLFCDCLLKSMFKFPANVATSVYTRTTAPEFNRLVAASLASVRISSDEMKQMLLLELMPDIRAEYRGYCLQADIPALNLCEGYRLVPSDDLPDVFDLAALEPPFTLSFFRGKGNEYLNFVCVLFSIIGFSLDLLHLDVMHVLDLGVLQHLFAHVMWKLIVCNFCKSTKLLISSRHMQNLHYLNARLKEFYSALGPRNRRTNTRVAALTFSRLGKQSKPRLRAKAAQTRHLLPFIHGLVLEFSGKLGANLQLQSRSWLFLKAAVIEMYGYSRRSAHAAGMG